MEREREQEKENRDKPWALEALQVLRVVVLVFTLGMILRGLAVTSSAVSVMSTDDRQEDVIPTFSLPTAASAGRMVIPLGCTVGIKLFSDGVLVVGLAQIETESGTVSPARDCGLKTGDIITHMGGQEVNSIEEVQQCLRQTEGSQVSLTVTRSEKELQLAVTPVAGQNSSFQLGAWIRDSMAGIGTMTFFDPTTGVFGALGHGINDIDTAQLMPLRTGGILPSTVSDVKKGVSGSPGELHGVFDVAKELGGLFANTDRGVFGQLTDLSMIKGKTAMEVAQRSEVKVGEATIRSNIAGDAVEEYTVKITHVYPETEGDTRSLMLEVTDARLLELTGGIVQGMSGSPVLQNGKLVGAVTHVLVSDPTRGYGILAEDMLEETICAEEQAS